VTTTLLFGDLRGGRIYDTLDVTGCSWEQVANDAGSITSVTVEAHEVRRKLKGQMFTASSFLAVDVDGRLQEAGPVWSLGWDDEAQQLGIGAAGLWSLFDHRTVLPVLAADARVQDAVTTVSGTDLGGIGRALVAQALTHAGGDLPLVLPDPPPGDRTESWYGWQLAKVGDQIRQLTQRADNAPDIRFRPDYTADRLGVQWFYEAGTEAAPLLTQAGDDWYFDQTVAKSPVLNINTDEDGTQMGMLAWATGNGSEADILLSHWYDPTLVDAGWPLLEVYEADSTVEDQGTLDDHAQNLAGRSARPPVAWKVVVKASAAREVLAGHYARVVVRDDHPWLPGGETFLRVAKKSGDLTDKVTLTMYPILDTF
jgi:hypothetical protein